MTETPTYRVEQHKPGDLRIWWIPQIPMATPFTVDVATVEEGAKLLIILADYDLFQLEHNIKPDFSNAGGLDQFDSDSDGKGTPGWISWFDEETSEDDPIAWLEAKGMKV